MTGPFTPLRTRTSESSWTRTATGAPIVARRWSESSASTATDVTSTDPSSGRTVTCTGPTAVIGTRSAVERVILCRAGPRASFVVAWTVYRIERIAGGGFDNPVELIFGPAGSIIGTMDQSVGDCLLHYVEGGVYPRMDQPCVAEFQRTGPALTPALIYPENVPPALCGIERIRAAHLGPEYQGRLLTAQFNVHKVHQHVLTADGATWRADAHEFFRSVEP